MNMNRCKHGMRVYCCSECSDRRVERVEMYTVRWVDKETGEVRFGRKERKVVSWRGRLV